MNSDVATSSTIAPDIIIIEFRFNKLEDMGCFFDFLENINDEVIN